MSANFRLFCLWKLAKYFKRKISYACFGGNHCPLVKYQMAINKHWFGQWSTPTMWQAITLTNPRNWKDGICIETRPSSLSFAVHPKKYAQSPLLLTLFIVNPWTSNNIPGNVWDEITFPFPNFNGAISYHILIWMWLLINAGIKVKPC